MLIKFSPFLDEKVASSSVYIEVFVDGKNIMSQFFVSEIDILKQQLLSESFCGHVHLFKKYVKFVFIVSKQQLMTLQQSQRLILLRPSPV